MKKLYVKCHLRDITYAFMEKKVVRSSAAWAYARILIRECSEVQSWGYVWYCKYTVCIRGRD